MNADHAKFLAGVIGQNLQGEWMHTYKAINAINDAKKDYKPADDSRSAWDLAHHIAVCDVGFLQAVADNSFANFPAKCDAKTIPALADWYKHEMPKALEKVLALDGQHLSPDRRVVGHEAAVGQLHDVLQQPHDSSSRPADHLHPPDGRQGAGDVWRKLRREDGRVDPGSWPGPVARSLVLAGTLAVPLGLRAINGALPGAEVRDSYIPTVESPRPREPFDQEAADVVREAQPEFVVIGDSMAGIRIDPLQLSRQAHSSVIGLYQQGSPVAYWYLVLKNLVAENRAAAACAARSSSSATIS